jgi:CelD/BcsL family acetyltransferase involved in cellulose biosynthesis
MMIVELVKEKSLKSLEKDWNRLLDGCKDRNVFMSYEWNKAWINNLLGEGKLHLLVARDSSIRGIFPFVLHKNVIRFAGSPISDYAGFIVADDDNKPVAEAFRYLKEKITWNRMALEQIPVSLLSQYDFQKPWFSVSSYSSYAVDFREFKEQELHKLLGKKDIKRKLSYLRKMGGFDYRVISTGNDMHDNLEMMFAQHTERWKNTKTPSMFRFAGPRDFIHEAAESLNARGMLNFCSLEIDRRPISYIFGFVYNNIQQAYTTTYDSKFERVSPGLLLYSMDIENAFGNGLSVYDFGRGNEHYKTRFANREIKTMDVHVFRKSSIYAANIAFQRARKLLRLIK